MPSIIEFLEARIAEDEKRAAYYGPLTLGMRRLLAECAAKRAILANIPKLSDPYSTLGGTSEYVLRCMASVYSDHPDYQKEWVV